MIAPSFAEFQDKILALYHGPGHAVRTYKKMDLVLRHVGQLGIGQLTELDTLAAARFVAERSKAVCPNTVRGEVSYLRAAVSYAVEEGWLDRPPRWRRILPRANRPARITLHSIEEIRRVLELTASRCETWQGHRLHALAATLAHTGLRRDESLNLQLADIDLAASILRVEARTRLKTAGSEAPVPIPPDLLPILAEWLPSAGPLWVFPGERHRGRWNGGNRKSQALGQLAAVGREADVRGLTFQSLRHTFATWCRRRWGLSAIELRDVLRHRTIHTQEHYVHSELDTGPLVESVRAVTYR